MPFFSYPGGGNSNCTLDLVHQSRRFSCGPLHCAPCWLMEWPSRTASRLDCSQFRPGCPGYCLLDCHVPETACGLVPIGTNLQWLIWGFQCHSCWLLRLCGRHQWQAFSHIPCGHTGGMSGACWHACKHNWGKMATCTRVLSVVFSVVVWGFFPRKLPVVLCLKL